jgi:hypothetical protein
MYGAVLLVMALLQIGTHGFRSSPTWVFFLGLWFGLGIGADFLFGMIAWQKLQDQFRLAAQQQYLPPGGLLSQIFPRSPTPGSSLGEATLGVKTG